MLKFAFAKSSASVADDGGVEMVLVRALAVKW